MWWPTALAGGLACAVLTLQSVTLTATFVIVALVACLYARSRTAGLAAMWAVWLLVPALRRIIGLSEGYGAADPLAVAPFLATALVGAAELYRARLSRRATRIMYLAVAGVAFGVPAGLLSTPKAALFAIFAYGAGILAFAIGYREPQDRELTLVNVLMVVAAPIALYAVLQSVLPLPRWDEVWLQSVDFVSAGNQAEGTLRSFATLNSPGTLATVLGLAIVFLLTTRRFNVLQVGILLLLLAGVSVTLVRSVWIALAVALLAMVIIAPSRAGRRVLLVAAVAAIALPLLGGGSPIAGTVGERAGTIFALDEDSSADARVATPSVVIPYALDQPLGIGLGGAGEPSRLADQSALRATDNAIVSLILQCGPVGLLLILAGVAMGWASAVRNVRRRASIRDLGVLASLALLTVLMLTGDVFYGVAGAVLWYLLGVAVRTDDMGRLREAT